MEIVQHPDIGNEVEIANTDHNKAAQLTARIQNGSDQFLSSGSVPDQFHITCPCCIVLMCHHCSEN